jgi:hypothetical protein
MEMVLLAVSTIFINLNYPAERKELMTTNEADVAAIKALAKQYDEAIIAGDLEGYLALFVEEQQ